jgi:hypothetical protein
MPRLSAIDAVAPAIERTKAMLFRPFDFKTWMIMGVIGWLGGEGMGGGFNFSFPMGGHPPGKRAPVPPSAPGPHFPTALLVLVIAVVVLVVSAIAVAFIYLFSRFRFVLFDSVLSAHAGIDKGWRSYREQAHRYFWFWVAAGVVMLLTFALALGVPVLLAFKRGVFEKSPPPLDELFALIGIVFLAAVTIGVVFYVFSSLARDFIVPLMALDDLRIGRAWAALKDMLKTEPGSFAGYLGLKLLMSFVASIALAIPVILLFFFLVIGGVIVAIFARTVVHAPSSGLIVAAVVLGGLFFMLFLFVLLGLALFLSAPIAVFFTSYALYFFGGRYPRLGDLLWPTPLPPVAPPPPAMAPTPAPAS